ncbi:MAG TPA: DUF402 domain-containing protein [Dehalococcoidia bacterium]|nr:DUF402 domain-containing protein [Dehalococcoidia bacterium]
MPDERIGGLPGDSEPGRQVLVRKLCFDGRLNWAIRGLLAARCNGRATIVHPLGTALTGDGSTLAVLRHRPVVHYLWSDRWYSVFDLGEPHGLRHWYGNVQTPAVFDGELISYIDLDLDVVLEPDAPPRLVDEDEFLEACERLRYPAAVVEQAWEATACLLRAFAGRVHDFLRRKHLGPLDDPTIAAFASRSGQ